MPKIVNRYRVHITPAYLLLVLLSLPLAANANQETPPVDVAMLNLTVGKIGFADNIDAPLRYGIEFRMPALSQWKIIPAFGVVRAENGPKFLYTDLRHDFWLADRWVVIPSFGLGVFDDSEDIQLGSELMFRTGIELAYRFYGQYRIGVALFHLSNGGLSNKNPGTEALALSLTIPLGR